ncbi:hypothetical protein Ahy_B05g079161 [Arachis hypogaea]|uniref:Protein FAR1-RELATED SEQUENCE n=1 Tax=Arachis hypogaea TaxID=3818 RepID=A0A444Z934_ARAHY|nr:hypothetical protein Ahy_B05g079161 [Arachis hypogaea]
MIFKTPEEAGKFYKNYSKFAGFSTKIRNTIRKGDEIKNKLITYSRERKWKSKISPTLKTNSLAIINCPARIYIISKVVLNHYALAVQTEQRCLNNTGAKHSFVAAAGGHHELSFSEKDVRNYITREVRNVFEQYNAKKFGKKWNNFLTKYGAGGNKWLSEAQFQHVYTHEKFRKVQVQFRGKVNCITRSIHFTLGFTAYEVVEQVFNSTFNKFVVTYDVISRKVKCQCLLFESRGILCRYSLSALSFERFDKNKNVTRRHTHIKSSQDEPLLSQEARGLTIWGFGHIISANLRQNLRS